MTTLLTLSLIALATAAALLLVVRHTSDQAGIAQARRAIRAGLFEIRLFNDDLHAILRAQREILRHNLTYLRHSAVPVLWVLLPLALVLGQLQACYGYDGLQPGQSALLKVTVAEDAGEAPELGLEGATGVRIESPPVWIPSLREAAWRIGAEGPGDYEVTVSVNGEPVTKRVHVGRDVARRSPHRLPRGVMNWILFPGETALPSDSVVQSIEVTYPARAIPVLGWEAHWTVIFFALTLAFAVLLRRPLGVVL